MKFKHTHDVDVPVQYLFDRSTNFERGVQLAQQRGVNVRRADSLPEIGPGAIWDAVIKIRRRPRDFRFTLQALEQPEGFEIEVASAIFKTDIRVDTVSLGREQSRIAVVVETKPLNLRGRLLIQSLKLARGRIKNRVDQGLFKFVKRVEADYRGES